MQDTYRITALEDKYFRVPWYAEIKSGTKGTVTPPTGGIIVLNQWAGSVSAKSSTLTITKRPTGIAAKTAGGVDIAVTISINGAWALSGTPSAYPIGIIYYYDVKLFNFNRNYSLDTAVAIGMHTQGTDTTLGEQTEDLQMGNFAITGVGEIRLTPKASSSGAEGTIFYDSDDDHVYVATE